MAYDRESGVHYVQTLHDQELTVSVGYDSEQPKICIWIAESDTTWPLVLNRDEDALLVAKLLIEAALSRDEPDVVSSRQRTAPRV